MPKPYFNQENKIKEILMVNHAGEFGAQRIYQGQIAFTKKSDNRSIIQHMLQQELEHLNYFENEIKNEIKNENNLDNEMNDMIKSEDDEENNLNIFNSFGYSFNKNKKFTTMGLDYWHPGYAWAITRKAYEKIGGLYDKGVLGSGDNIMALSFINRCKSMNNINYGDDYNNSMLDYQVMSHKLRLGYVPGVIRHHYHGSKKNRNYTERWKILMKHKFSPIEHLTYDSQGILIPTNSFPQGFKEDIMNYFNERKEDE